VEKFKVESFERLLTLLQRPSSYTKSHIKTKQIRISSDGKKGKVEIETLTRMSTKGFWP
jgi:hypothetical protein